MRMCYESNRAEDCMTADDAPVGLSQMSLQLPDDIWNSVFRSLIYAQVRNLLLTGDRRLINLISRLKMVKHRCAYHRESSFLCLPHWPPNIHATSSITELEYSVIDIHGQPWYLSTPFELKLLPRSLQSLTLQLILPHPWSWPFAVASAEHAPKQIELLTTSFPFLHTLKVGIRFSQVPPSSREPHFWTLPPSITHLSSSHSVFIHPDISLPPNLIHCRSDVFDLKKPFLFPSTLETLTSSNLQVNLIGNNLPYLHRLASFGANSRLHAFPSLTTLRCHSFPSDFWQDNHLPHLTYLASRAQYLPSNCALLPRSLTLVVLSDTGRPLRFSPASTPYLPPALKELYFLHDDSVLPHRVLSTLPLGLIKLDLGGASLNPKGCLKGLPPTLTSLATKGINKRNIGQLNSLPNLLELKLIGGHITYKVALQLPRRLTSLTLYYVRLPIKSLIQPITDALKGSLPPFLKTLDIRASRRQIYWWTHAYDILIAIPISLQILRLDFGSNRIMNVRSTHPCHTSSMALSPSLQLSQDQPSNLFTRLINLRHLYLVCKQFEPPIVPLPPNLYAYRGPVIHDESVIRSLPKSIRLLHAKSCAGLSQKHYDILRDHLGHAISHYWHEDVPSVVFDPTRCSLDRRNHELTNL